MSSRTQTTEVLLRWKYVRQAVGRALYTLEQFTISEAIFDTSQTRAEEQIPKRTLRKKLTIRYDTRCYFNVRWKANMSQIK